MNWNTCDFRLKSQVKANCLPVSHSLEKRIIGYHAVWVFSVHAWAMLSCWLQHAMCKTELGDIQVTSQVQFEYSHATIHSLLWLLWMRWIISHPIEPYELIVFSWFRHIWGFALYRSLSPAACDLRLHLHKRRTSARTARRLKIQNHLVESLVILT